jgi:hypothetical protein
MTPHEIKGRGNQSQDAGEYKRGPDRLSGRKTNNEQQRGHRKTPASNSGESDSQGNEKT